MRRIFAIFIVPVLGLLSAFAAVTPAAATNSIEMDLDQTILVWTERNDNYTPGVGWNYDIEMSTLSTLTGEAAPVGYTFQPALDMTTPCPAPYQAYFGCGGPIMSAALNPIDRATYGLMAGADSPNSVIYKIDPSTAVPSFSSVLTLNGTQPFNIRGIFFDDAGNLYAWWVGFGPSANVVVYSIDVTDGTMTEFGSLPKAAVTGSVSFMTFDETGNLWAFCTSTDGPGTEETFANIVDLSGQTANQQFSIPGLSLNEGAFDKNGYFWFDTFGMTSSELYSLDMSDPVGSLTHRATLSPFSGAFVISDVPFPTATGVAPGETIAQYADVNVDISHARASSGYTIEIHSTPVELATGNVSQGGSASVPFEIPASVEPGNHEIVLSYVAPNGRTVTETIPVTVKPGLPNTGVDATTPSLAATGLLVLGIVCVAWVARRRSRIS